MQCNRTRWPICMKLRIIKVRYFVLKTELRIVKNFNLISSLKIVYFSKHSVSYWTIISTAQRTKKNKCPVFSQWLRVGLAPSLCGSWRHADNQLRNLRLCCLAVVDLRVPFPETFLYLANSIDISTSQLFTYQTVTPS